ncbi:MAG: Fic family protein, partial [Deltaproteobacteria bacterium]|nr:Fic family protein [Deltaproteobacteria bacterium]
RIQRWGRAIGQAGRRPLNLDELLRLQAIVIGDARFVRMGLRQDGGFIGEHDRYSRMPLPDHISARPEDLTSLIGGMAAFDRGPAQRLDAVIAAAVLAFGFVYIHPFEDGNGRIHRYLIHHVLAQRGFNPAGVVFPISAAILERIDEYRTVLESYSQRLLPLIRWESTPEGNVKVLNETADYYRFFDATPHAEFLYSCVKKTVEEDLPNETDFLRRYDLFRARIEDIVDMPNLKADLLFQFLHQNGGKLSKRAREKEFEQMTDAEIATAEQAYAAAFQNDQTDI